MVLKATHGTYIYLAVETVHLYTFVLVFFTVALSALFRSTGGFFIMHSCWQTGHSVLRNLELTSTYWTWHIVSWSFASAVTSKTLQTERVNTRQQPRVLDVVCTYRTVQCTGGHCHSKVQMNELPQKLVRCGGPMTRCQQMTVDKISQKFTAITPKCKRKFKLHRNANR